MSMSETAYLFAARHIADSLGCRQFTQALLNVWLRQAVAVLTHVAGESFRVV
jgi:hypothetical protein